MPELGEPSGAPAPTEPAASASPGDLVVTITETTSGEAVPEVKVSLVGPSPGDKTTPASGEASFSGLKPGVYRASLTQDEFQLTPATATVAVKAGGKARLEIAVKRIMTSVTLKRIHVQGLAKAAVGDKSQLEYGHWWTEIGTDESYGWWPKGRVSVGGTLRGVPGSLNGQGGIFNGTPTRDPHHGDAADEMMHPRVATGKTAAAIKADIRSFAASYSGSWSWPLGQNCHSFQEALLRRCGMEWAGGTPLPKP